jgi:hypothetical protein
MVGIGSHALPPIAVQRCYDHILRAKFTSTTITTSNSVQHGLQHHRHGEVLTLCHTPAPCTPPPDTEALRHRYYCDAGCSRLYSVRRGAQLQLGLGSAADPRWPIKLSSPLPPHPQQAQTRSSSSTAHHADSTGTAAGRVLLLTPQSSAAMAQACI